MPSRCHVRCRKCRARRVLPMAPELYARRPPVCQLPGCGGSLVADKWMNNRPTAKMGCECAGYWFKHRKGSLFCWWRADGSGRYPGDTDFRDRYMDDCTNDPTFIQEPDARRCV